MNIVFVYGEVLEDVEFKFIVEGKHMSIARFLVKLANDSIIRINAYDEVADMCYMWLSIGSYVAIQGSINLKGEIKAEEVDVYYNLMKSAVNFSFVNFL